MVPGIYRVELYQSIIHMSSGTLLQFTVPEVKRINYEYVLSFNPPIRKI
jgi:hypothetical protein